MSIDFGKTSADYAKHRAGFPEAFFARLDSFGIGKTGQRALDLGTGTGTVARGLARRGCIVTGLDKSAALMEQAKRLDSEAGVAIQYLVGRAEETGLPPASFDVVTAGQCWHWFDRPRVAREIHRLLAPGGTLVIGHFDWLPLPGNLAEATEKLIATHNPGFEADNPTWKLSGGTGLYPAWLADVAGAGLHNIETFSFDVAVPYSHEAWRGRMRASASVGASLSPDSIARFDADLGKLLQERFPEDPVMVPHRVWAVICRVA
ncbi:MAG: class I SAM-dependent methyltransferase [Myxococcaceae bacterium]